MPKPIKPTDQYVVNGWYLELPGLVSPHFETLEGVEKSTGSVDIVDAGTNKRLKFSGQIVDFGEMTLTRTKQGTTDDAVLAALVQSMQSQGVKVNCVAVKMHHGREAFRILFEGFRFAKRSLPGFDVNSESKFVETYTATCDDWTEL